MRGLKSPPTAAPRSAPDGSHCAVGLGRLARATAPTELRLLPPPVAHSAARRASPTRAGRIRRSAGSGALRHRHPAVVRLAVHAIDRSALRRRLLAAISIPSPSPPCPRRWLLPARASNVSSEPASVLASLRRAQRRRGGGGRWGEGAAGDRCLPCCPLGRATREFFPAAKTYSIFIIGKDSPSLFPGSLSIPFACGLSWHWWPSRAV